MKTIDEASTARFWSKVDVGHPLGCWEWAGALRRDGYGAFSVGSRTDGTSRQVLAHRVAYELLIGLIPDGLVIDHLCRNRGCVNPDHLEPVTNRENVRRGYVGAMAGARQAAKSHCPQGHEYDEANTYVDRSGGRYCRACRNERSREWRKRPGSREKRAEYQRAYRAGKRRDAA